MFLVEMALSRPNRQHGSLAANIKQITIKIFHLVILDTIA